MADTTVTDSKARKRVGFAGLGIMGARMAQSLARKGWPLAVWNRTPERAREVVAAAGGEAVAVAATPRALAEAADVVVTCVADPAAVERVVFADDGVLAAARPGFRYVECSTIAPGQVRRIAAAMEARGAAVLDAPVTGSRLGAERATLLFMTGGAAALHAELEPLLLAMGARAIHCGPSGHGALTKIIVNAVGSFMLAGLGEGLVAARKGGLAPETVLEVIAGSGYASPYFAFKGAAMRARDWDTHFSIDLLAKDQRLMLAEGTEQRTPLPGLAAIHEVFQAARAQGLGEKDVAAVIEALERAAGL